MEKNIIQRIGNYNLRVQLNLISNLLLFALLALTLVIMTGVMAKQTEK